MEPLSLDTIIDLCKKDHQLHSFSKRLNAFVLEDAIDIDNEYEFLKKNLNVKYHNSLETVYAYHLASREEYKKLSRLLEPVDIGYKQADWKNSKILARTVNKAAKFSSYKKYKLYAKIINLFLKRENRFLYKWDIIEFIKNRYVYSKSKLVEHATEIVKENLDYIINKIASEYERSGNFMHTIKVYRIEMQNIFKNKKNIENLNNILKITRKLRDLERGCYSLLDEKEKKWILEKYCTTEIKIEEIVKIFNKTKFNNLNKIKINKNTIYKLIDKELGNFVRRRLLNHRIAYENYCHAKNIIEPVQEPLAKVILFVDYKNNKNNVIN